MHDDGGTRLRKKRRPFKAIMAVFLAFTLVFLSFDPTSLRLAFAEGAPLTQGEVLDEAGDDPGSGANAPQSALEADGSDSEDEPVDEALSEGEGTPDPLEPQVDAPDKLSADDVSDDGAGDVDARAGPDDADGGSDLVVGEEDGEAGTPGDEAPELARATDVAACVVTFYDDVAAANPAIIARKAVTAESGATAIVPVHDIVANPPTGAQVFSGWAFKGEVRVDAIEVDPRGGDVSLYPVFSSGHWLRFVAGDNGSGAVAVASRFVAADEPAPTTLPVTTRSGYAFDGWFAGADADGASSGERITDAEGVVLDPAALKEKLGSGDVELFARWTGVQTTYRLITWHENPDDEGYSFISAETIGDDSGERAISGEMTGAREMPEVEGFELSHVEDKVIAGDGSTVVHATYDRREYSVVFHRGPSMDDPLFEELTITAKYGADVSDKWPKPFVSDEYTSSWHTLPNDDDTFVNGINTMPLGGAHFFVKTDSGMNFSIVFLVQSITGANEFEERRVMPFSARVAPDTTPDDYMPIKGFVVNAASEEDAAKIRAIPSGDKAATHVAEFDVSTPVRTGFKKLPVIADADGVERYTAHFRYLRCQYDIVFEENGGPEVLDANDVYYEAPLSGLAPAEYVVGETTYEKPNGEKFVFAGWYANDALVGDGFDFDNAKMPANNLVLYAKWEPARYLVQVDPAGGEFVNPAQSSYFWVGHGDQVDSIDIARGYVADPDGAYVYEYEPYGEGADGFGEARYVEAPSDAEGQRYRRADGAYTLYGWYRIVDGALVPFDFSEGVTGDTSIVARWRSAGSFDIAYDAAVHVDGTKVTGLIGTPLDAGYADLSPTYIVNTPTDIAAEDGTPFAFVGWKVVEHFGEDAPVLVDGLYREGDSFVVDSTLARDNLIHLQAVYERIGGGSGGEVDPDGPSSGEDGPTVGPQGGSSDNDAPSSGNAGAEKPGVVSQAQSGGAESARQTPAGGVGLPATGDMVAFVPLALAGVALIGFAIALIAFVGRRRDNR